MKTLFTILTLTLAASLTPVDAKECKCKQLFGKIGKSLVVGITRPPDRLPPLARVTPVRPGRPGNGPFKPVLEEDANRMVAGFYRTRAPGAGIA
jgi:hypothetical protein